MEIETEYFISQCFQSGCRKHIVKYMYSTDTLAHRAWNKGVVVVVVSLAFIIIILQSIAEHLVVSQRRPQKNASCKFAAVFIQNCKILSFRCSVNSVAKYLHIINNKKYADESVNIQICMLVNTPCRLVCQL